MKLTIALVLSLSVAASSSRAAVGFHVANGRALPHENIADTSVIALWETMAEGQRLDLLRMPLVLAQAGQQTQQGRVYTWNDGYIAGKIAAEDRGTAGSFVGGLTCGLLTGLIGTGILWGVTGGDDASLHLNANVRGKGVDYSTGFTQGYKERTKQKKRNARLGGGLLGTAGIVLLILSAN